MLSSRLLTASRAGGLRSIRPAQKYASFSPFASSPSRRFVGVKAESGSESKEGGGSSPASSSLPSPPVAAPRTRPGAQAPLKLERVENLASTSWGGVAQVDSGAADGGGLSRSLLLAVGDGACLLAFAAIGRASHGESVALFDLLYTAAPFVVSWYGWGLSGWGRAFDREARLASPGSAAATVLRTWLPYLPTAQLLRAASVGHVADVTFWGISGAVTLAFLVAWRGGLSAVAPAPGASKRGNKKGNVFEFLSLLKGLTTRW